MGDLGQNLGPDLGPRRESDVHERGARGDSLGVPPERPVPPPQPAGACRFPNKDNLYAWLKLEEAGELTARETPDRAERMHCSHGEGSPAFAARRAGAGPASPRGRRAEGGAGRMKGTGRGGAGGGRPEQTDWRDWGLEGLPDDPAERAREAEVRLAEALAVLDVLKTTRPWLFDERGEAQGWRGGEAALAGGEARGRDKDPVDPEEHLSTSGQDLEARPQGRAQGARARVVRGERRGLRARVRDRRPQEGARPAPSRGARSRPVTQRPESSRPRRSCAGSCARRAWSPARRRRCAGGRGTAALPGRAFAERPANVPLRGDRDARLPRGRASGLLVVTDVTEFRLDGYRHTCRRRSTASTGGRSAGGSRSTPTRT